MGRRPLAYLLCCFALLLAARGFAQEDSGGGADATQAQILQRLQALESQLAELRGVSPGTPAGPAAAKGTDAAAVLARLAALEKSVAGLKAARAAPKPQPPKLEAAVDPPGLEPRIESLEKKAQDLGIQLSGSLAVSYNYNFNDPDSRINRTRVFDTEHNEFSINLLDVIIQRPTDGPGTWGFRADLDVGEDPAVFQAAGFADGDNFELEQAYVDWIAPVGDGLTLRLGKFVTNHGAEVIESADNWNTSRSYLFGFAIPFTHTGFLASYSFFEEFALSAGVVNGWDNVDDNNDAKSFHGMLRWAPSDAFSVMVSGTYGAEQAGNDHDHRGLVTALITVSPWEDWTFMLDLDYGSEENAGVGTRVGEDAEWLGAALYAKYAIAEEWYAATRLEIFDDDDGARLGIVDQTFEEATLPLGWKPIAHAEVRLEYRHDWSDEDVFDEGDDLGTEDAQDTLSFEVIYRF